MTVAVKWYIPATIKSSATPTPTPTPRDTKVILPKKKAQKWSTGMAPGDYGGPPVSTKLRKYWGGEGEDPITSTDLIWNKDFMGRMKRYIQDTDSDPLLLPVEEKPSGFLSLNRVMNLNSMEVDLSKELTPPSKPVIEKHIEAVQSATSLPRWRHAPTRREQDKWDRATKAATGGTEVLLREVKQPRGDPKVLAAQSREQYIKLKNKMQMITLGIGGFGLISAYVSYSPEITTSYGAGLLGSLAYMRMLGSSVDSMADGARGVMKAAIGQPRILIPVILVLIFNRWNGILVPEYGFMQLQLIPMLVGFFTYKVSTFYQAIEEAVTIVGQKNESSE